MVYSFIHVKDAVLRSTFQIMLDDEDLEDLAESINNESFLDNYQHIEAYKGKTWEDLLPTDLMVLITSYCTALNGVTGDAREKMYEESSDFLPTLTKLLAQYIWCVQELNGAYVEKFILQILPNNTVHFNVDFTMSLSINEPLAKSPEKDPPGSLKIIIDNEKK